MFSQVELATIPQHSLALMVASAMDLLGFHEFEHEIVGNKDALYLNDIDIAIDRNQLEFYLQLKPAECLWSALERHLSQSGIERFVISKQFQQFHFLMPCANKGATALRKIDVFVGKISWMKAVASGAPTESKYKAIYRNLLLLSIFLEVVWPTESGDENEYFRYALSFREGLKKRKLRTTPPARDHENPKKTLVSEELITSDPDDIARILFDEEIGWSDINSFEKLRCLLGKKTFRYPCFLPKIYRNYVVTLGERKMTLPALDLAMFS